MSNKEFIRKKLMEGLSDTKPKRLVGGVLIKCTKTGNVFLLLRNDKTPTWALMSGTIEEGEQPLEGLQRELFEELFIRPNIIQYKFIGIEHIPEKNIEFHYYQGFTNSEFKPILDHENLNWGWFPKDKLPSPLFKGLIDKINAI